MSDSPLGIETIVVPSARSESQSGLLTTITTVAVLLLVSAVVIIVALAIRPTGGLAVPRGSFVVRVNEHDFGIQLDRTSFPAGNYVFVDTNRGPSAHELVMWKTSETVDRLPIATDNRVNEDSPALDNVLDSGTSLQPGELRLLTTTLTPGHYLLVCNLPGHFRAGMHVDITVR
jgi:uncharacterized cupredoxin-like copper-binding protein